MLSKIINSMFMGNLKTKVYLWSILIMLMAGAGLGIFAAAAASAQLGLGAFGLGVMAFVTSQSVSLKTLEKEKKPKQESGERDSKDSEKPAKEIFLSSMNEKKIKKILKEHKVKQSHVMVMIDSFPKMKIKQTPAFMWRTDTMLHFLVLDRGVGEFEVPLDKIQGILLIKNVEGDPQEDYLAFRKGNFISKLFAPFLPEYQEQSKDGVLCHTKNVFRVSPGISFTNTSVANVMKILNHLAFWVDDKVVSSDYFDEYFKEVYRLSILCKNNVITLEEYRIKMEENLEQLLVAPMSGRDFLKSLQDMQHYHLITNAYVIRYTQRYRETHMEM